MKIDQKKRPIQAYLGVFIIIFVGIGILITDYFKVNYPEYGKLTKSIVNDDANVDNASQYDESLKSLGFTAKEFGQQFNKTLNDTRLKSNKWNDLEQAGEQTDSFVIEFAKGVTLTGHINQNGELDKLYYVEQSNRDPKQTSIPLIKFTTGTARTLHPNASKRTINQQIKSLVNQVAINYSQTKLPQRDTINIENNTYTFEMTDTGITFIVEPSAKTHTTE